MKLIVLAVIALAAVVLAAPADQPEKPIAILRSDFEQQPNGGYVYSIETENGIQQSETGEPKVVNDEENKPHEVVVVRGSYSWTDPEGKTHTLSYIADENGFQPQSDDIPTPVRA